MNDAVDPFETPQAFLDRLGKNLELQPGVDLKLLGILKAHILSADPGATAPQLAAAAIVKLAGERVVPLDVEVPNA